MERKILIVDDSSDDREIMQRFLNKAGFSRLVFASDGHEGIAKAKKEKPDLIIMDLIMPKKGGSDTAAALETDKETKNIPIIFVTSLVRPGEQQGRSTRVFAKPFDSEELLRKVNEILQAA